MKNSKIEGGMQAPGPELVYRGVAKWRVGGKKLQTT